MCWRLECLVSTDSSLPVLYQFVVAMWADSAPVHVCARAASAKPAPAAPAAKLDHSADMNEAYLQELQGWTVDDVCRWLDKDVNRSSAVIVRIHLLCAVHVVCVSCLVG